jgi:uncharacterized protein (TIGR00369 family)
MSLVTNGRTAGIAPLDAKAVTALIDEHFPQVYEGSGALAIERVGQRRARVRMTQDASMMRPGGTVSGPTMFKLADFAIYVAILGECGADALQAVTTSMTMNFLTRPLPGDLLADVRIMKIGRRLTVAEVAIFADGHEEMVAHATGTYAMPPAARTTA